MGDVLFSGRYVDSNRSLFEHLTEWGKKTWNSGITPPSFRDVMEEKLT